MGAAFFYARLWSKPSGYRPLSSMAILYYLILKPLSYLPDRVLYFISDILFVIVYHLVPYRKKLVLDNMRRSFPEKTEEEIQLLAKKFYRHFCDVIIEILKGLSITEKEAQKRIRINNPEVLDKLFEEGRSLILTGGHYANWETLTLIAGRMKHELLGLYTPLGNRFLEKKVKASRSKFGFGMVPTKDYKEALDSPSAVPRAFVFAVDQSPKKGSGHWMTFLNQDTAVLFGTERTAKKYDMAIVAGRITKRARGRYELTYECLFRDPMNTAHGEITERCMKDVEEVIRRRPELWLWTHRRWKHKKEDA